MLKRRFRLRADKDFKGLYRRGRVAQHGAFVVRARPNGLAYSRLAVVISTKTAKKATTRNRLRRQITNLLAASWDTLAISHDYAVIVKQDFSGSADPLWQAELANCLKQLGVYTK